MTFHEDYIMTPAGKQTFPGSNYVGEEIGQSAKVRLAGTTTKVLGFGTSSHKYVPDTVSDLEQQLWFAILIHNIIVLDLEQQIRIAIPIQHIIHEHLFFYYQHATSSLNAASHIQVNEGARILQNSANFLPNINENSHALRSTRECDNTRDSLFLGVLLSIRAYY